jgi:hypothetical protein
MTRKHLWAICIAFASHGLGRADPAEPALSRDALNAAPEVSRKEVAATDHKITYIRIRTPALPKLPPAPEPQPLTAEEQATSDRMAEKAYVSLDLSATVYLGGKHPVTELRWRDESGENEYIAYSNADFRYLSHLNQIETATTVYAWFPFLYVYEISNWPADQKPPIPPGLPFESGVAEYFVDSRVAALKAEETTLAGLDNLHAYYQVHAAALKTDHVRREAESEAREKQLRDHPPIKPDTVIHFWPVQSRLNPR